MIRRKTCVILVPLLRMQWMNSFNAQSFSHFNPVNRGDFNVFKDSERSSISILYTNCDSLLNKCDEYDVLICCFKLKIILLTEILPKNCLNPPEKCEFNILGYECYIPSFKHGRGVAIFVYESLESVLIEPLTLWNYTESVWCSVRLANNDKLLVVCVYHSPSSSSDNNMKSNALLKNAVQFEQSHILICGDFNYKEINWKNLDTSVSIEHDASIFLENIRDTYLTQHVLSYQIQR